MFSAKSSTEVRKNWSTFIDDVVRNQPSMIKRNRDVLAVFSIDQLKLLLADHHLHLTLSYEDDGSVTGVIEEFDIVDNAPNEELLIGKLSREVMLYAEEYIENFQQYFNSPNRKQHFPHIFKILAL